MRTKDKLTLLLLGLLYLVVTIRYFPGRPAKTCGATLLHWGESVPIMIGLTILAVSVIKKVAGASPPPDRIARIYLTFALIGELFYGIYHYVSPVTGTS